MSAEKIPATTPAAKSDTVEVSRVELDALMSRVRQLEKVDAGEVANPIVAVTCNSCGHAVDEKTGKCDTHPGEFVNHVSIGRDPENGLRRQVIAKQTRA